MEICHFPPRRSWPRRYLENLTVALLVIVVAAAGTLAIVIDSMALPADPAVPQASVL
jgi:hypothetical protein